MRSKTEPLETQSLDTNKPSQTEHRPKAYKGEVGIQEER
jgi:hypothetical protein